MTDHNKPPTYEESQLCADLDRFWIRSESEMIIAENTENRQLKLAEIFTNITKYCTHQDKILFDIILTRFKNQEDFGRLQI